MQKLGGSVVVVTGASRGVGAAVAEAFASSGCHVVLAARTQEDIEALAARLAADHGVETMAVVADVTRTDQVDELMRSAAERLGGIDILVNNAGLGSYTSLADTSDDDMFHVMDVNLFGAIRCLRAAVPHMRRRGGGHVVNIGSIVSYMAVPRYRNIFAASPIYCASKFALRAATIAARAELHSDNIHVMLAVLGPTRTNFFRAGAGQVPPDALNAEDRGRLSFLDAAPDQVARQLVHAVQKQDREVYFTPLNFILVKLAVWAPHLYDLLLRLCFLLLGRPEEAPTAKRAPWQGAHYREWIPFAGLVVLGGWCRRRLKRFWK